MLFLWPQNDIWVIWAEIYVIWMYIQDGGIFHIKQRGAQQKNFGNHCSKLKKTTAMITFKTKLYYYKEYFDTSLFFTQTCKKYQFYQGSLKEKNNFTFLPQVNVCERFSSLIYEHNQYKNVIYSNAVEWI